MEHFCVIINMIKTFRIRDGSSCKSNWKGVRKDTKLLLKMTPGFYGWKTVSDT